MGTLTPDDASPGLLVEPLHIPLLTHLQRSVHKHLKEGQVAALVEAASSLTILQHSTHTCGTHHTHQQAHCTCILYMLSLNTPSVPEHQSHWLNHPHPLHRHTTLTLLTITSPSLPSPPHHPHSTHHHTTLTPFTAIPPSLPSPPHHPHSSYHHTTLTPLITTPPSLSSPPHHPHSPHHHTFTV